jgi:hypothetical protein
VKDQNSKTLFFFKSITLAIFLFLYPLSIKAQDTFQRLAENETLVREQNKGLEEKVQERTTELL